MKPYRSGLKPLAQQLRRQQTDAEAALWYQLRRQQLGVTFNRQKPIGNYIVDFYSASAKLVIELDGSQHLTQQGQHDDQRRDQYLLSLGLSVLRFDNLQVLNEIEGVMTVILESVQKQIPPNPPFSKGGATVAEK
ncbi:MAG: endonuclease domain-containing protein, partial [Deefgea sp.]